MSDTTNETPRKDNTALKIVLIVVAVVFGLPIILTIAALIFISLNFDKFTDWLDKHIDEDIVYQESNKLDDERHQAALNIYSAATNERIRESSGVTKADCMNMQFLAEAIGGNYISDDYCSASEIQIAAKDTTNRTTLYLASDEKCAEFTFYKNLNYIDSYRLSSSNNCPDTYKTKVIDTNEIPSPILNKLLPGESDDDDIEIEIRRS